MKKYLSILFATMLAGQAWAQDFESDGLFYTITSSIDPYFVEVSGGKAYLTDVVIPDSVNYEGMVYAITGIGNEAFQGNTKITSVNIGNCVTYIGFRAFKNCSNLKTVFISNSVTKIWYDAFEYCTQLETIDIPNSVKHIGDHAFYGCFALTSFTIPDSLTTIGYGVFASCGLQSIIIPNSVTSIGWNAFDNCLQLRTVIIGNSVNLITGSFNSWNESLKEVICLNPTPANLNGDVFCVLDTIYVPYSAVDAYKKADIWMRKEILPFYIVKVTSMDNTGIVRGDSLLLENKTLTFSAVPANGYHFVKWSDGNTDNPRTYSTAKDTSFTAIFEAHTTVTSAAVVATCTTTGLTEGSHCSVCNAVLVAQETIAALGHTEVVEASVAPTCTKTGLTEGKYCSVCNAVLVEQTEIPMVEHTIVTDAAVAATETETGLTEGSHCSVCGAVIVAQEVIPALGNPGTAVTESAANVVNIYAHGNTIIVVENATDEIRVYNAMGALVCRDVACRVRAELQVNGAGVYIVKVGSVAKRVMIND